MYANLFGDFVKGSDLHRYSEKIQFGIQLHRSIDQYIDHHPDVVELMRMLYPHLPKVTGIAIDLFFDHLLSSQWEKFHSMDYDAFLSKFYAYDIVVSTDYSQEFISFVKELKQHNWLSHYPTRFGLERMCEGVSKRISFKNELTNAPKVFDQFQPAIQKAFLLYMKDAIPYFNTRFAIQ